MMAALVGLTGFRVLAAAEAGGELELLVETSADLVGCRWWGGGASEGPASDVGAGPADRRTPGGDLLGQADLVLPAPAM